MEMITVYHGTSAHYWDKIEEEGLVAQRHRKHVYVTTDYEKAKDYAFIWTGGLLYEEKELLDKGEIEFPMIETEGVIFTFEVPKNLLKIDDYNLEGEPNQYKVLNSLSTDYIVDVEEVIFDVFTEEDFDEEKYKSEILRARALLVGVSQWGED